MRGIPGKYVLPAKDYGNGKFGSSDKFEAKRAYTEPSRPAQKAVRLAVASAAVAGLTFGASSIFSYAIAETAAPPAALADQVAVTAPRALKTRVAPPTKVETKGRRIIAVGDVHGDLSQAIRALQLANLVDAKSGSWTGGDTILVQVGDVFDRGDNEIAIHRMFRRLAKQAAEAGGAVYVINGNHEIMNVAGDFRYATPLAFEKFSALYTEKFGAPKQVRRHARRLGIPSWTFDLFPLLRWQYSSLKSYHKREAG
ncbi:hypothetical protein CYMTET_6367 [Cymbomonas tetramitiformis]|uniref:Calcineurin-like phosphoesterase domain-containing protein n=1 Tax=Cymbomonas tetramitiformis TaxID=36881 RepID=A0AAE0LIJ3_9CHLO|nr:hypothetical protein CYMTET_6367 [Cymbomonas tetramitiformis]